MTIRAIELVRASLDLVTPMRTSYGVNSHRDVLYVHIIGDHAEGWGECVALPEPGYTDEYVDGCEEIIRAQLLPLVAATTTAQEFIAASAVIPRNYMAKAAIEMALLDYWLRVEEKSLATYLGATHTSVVSGVSIGIYTDIDELLGVIAAHHAEGYSRVKLKIEPGNDLVPVRAVRNAFGDSLLLQVDANSAYTLDDAKHLSQLDQFNLLLIEQPLAEDDVSGHAQLAKVLHTPICLDESVVSVESARHAIEAGACSIVNLKAGRVGGFLEAKKIHDLCVERNVPVWCGGMYETGIGRAAALALAALPGFTLPSDLSASKKYFHEDVTVPFELVNGTLSVPNSVGIGVVPIPEVLQRITVHTELFRR
jgi:O-succinylbenzoate synthase